MSSKKLLPQPEAERIFVSTSSPLFVGVLLDHSRGFSLACGPVPAVSSSGGDNANRVLKLGKRISVNHSSIGGSWPIAISGYPRGHSVITGTRCRSTQGPTGSTDTHPRTERLENPIDHHQKESPEMERDLHQRRSSCLLIQFFGVEIHSFLPNR
jgi:hypothetical protein